jgi:hypothetical protein
VGDGALRPPPLQRVLPLLHREGVGDPGHRDPLPVGGAADQGLLLLARGPFGAAPRPAGGDDADRGVPLPAARPGPAVGAPAGSARRRLRHPRAAQASLRLAQARRQRDQERGRAQERRRHGARRRRRPLVDPAQRARLQPRPRRAAGGARRGAQAALPRLLPRRPDDDRGGALPGQLDLHPRPGHEGRPGAELRRLEPGDGAAGHDVPRRRVLLLRGRRHLGDERRGPRWRASASSTRTR